MYALLFLITALPVLFIDADARMVVLAILTLISGVLGNGYQKKYKYLTIENESIPKNNRFKKEVQLSAIKTI